MTSYPRSAASQAIPAPVPPPPTTSTSVCNVVMPRSSLARRGGGPERAPPPGAWSLLVLEPVEGPRDGLLPVLEVLVALALVHLGLPALVLLPVLAQVLLLGPEAGREARGVRGAQRRGLRHDGPDDRHAEQVGLELHEQLVLHHAAVDLQRLEIDARVLVHRLDDLTALVRRGLERRPRDVPRRDEAGQAGEDAARVGLPVR